MLVLNASNIALFQKTTLLLFTISVLSVYNLLVFICATQGSPVIPVLHGDQSFASGTNWIRILWLKSFVIPIRLCFNSFLSSLPSLPPSSLLISLPSLLFPLFSFYFSSFFFCSPHDPLKAFRLPLSSFILSNFHSDISLLFSSFTFEITWFKLSRVVRSIFTDNFKYLLNFSLQKSRIVEIECSRKKILLLMLLLLPIFASNAFVVAKGQSFSSYTSSVILLFCPNYLLVIYSKLPRRLSKAEHDTVLHPFRVFLLNLEIGM